MLALAADERRLEGALDGAERRGRRRVVAGEGRRRGGRVVPVVERRRRRGGPAGDDGRVGIGLDLVGGGVEPGRDDVLGRPERRRRRPRARACATSAKGFSRWALRMALFVLRRRSGAQRTVRRRVAAPRRILLCTAFVGCCLFFPLEHAATKRGAPQKSDAVEWQEAVQYASVAWGRSAAVARSTCASS